MAGNDDFNDDARLQAAIWIRQFIAVYGHGAITVLSRHRLNGVGLARVFQALELGTVIDVKNIGNAILDCKVEYAEEKDFGSEVSITVFVHASIYYTALKLVINFVEERKENPSEATHAA